MQRSVDDFEPAFYALDVITHLVHSGLQMRYTLRVTSLVAAKGRNADFEPGQPMTMFALNGLDLVDVGPDDTKML